VFLQLAYKVDKEKLKQVFCIFLHFSYGTNAREEGKITGGFSWKAFTAQIHMLHAKLCLHLHTYNINKLQKEVEFQASDKEFILFPEWDIVTVSESKERFSNCSPEWLVFKLRY